MKKLYKIILSFAFVVLINTFAQTNFYLDFEGHLDEKPVQNAMEELGFHTQSLDILGVYEASKFREK